MIDDNPVSAGQSNLDGRAAARYSPYAFSIEGSVRRFADIAVSLGVLVLGAPLLLLIGLILRWESPGPALFWQVRLGACGFRPGAKGENEPDDAEFQSRQFTMVKFRTMHVDARERFPDLYEYQRPDAEIQTVKLKLRSEDPRLTRFGAWLRSTSLDELPNFWNVLTGSMTLVGPRPEIPEMLHCYSPAERRKFFVKPGITGLAQINGRGLLSFRETVAFDLEYVDTRSLRGDVAILWRTLVAVIKRDGAF